MKVQLLMAIEIVIMAMLIMASHSIKISLKITERAIVKEEIID